MIVNPFESFINIADPDQLSILNKEILHNQYIHIYWKDLKDRYHYCNDQLATDVGLSKNTAAMGHTDIDLWPGSVEPLDAQDKKVYSENKPSIFIEEGIHPKVIMDFIDFAHCLL